MDVQRVALPLAASILALSWLAAQALDSWFLAALTLAISVALGCGGSAIQRRERGLMIAALTVALVTFGVILALHILASGPEVLKIQIAFLVLLAPLLPLVYAWTFQATESDRSDS
jgi:hypothetical protein